MVKTIILLLIIGIVFYLLYINGFLIAQSKKAILYVGALKGNRNKCNWLVVKSLK